MEPKERSSFYHHLNKGCNLVPAMKSAGKYKKKKRIVERFLHFFICTTHGLDVCRCGWQFTKHPVNQKSC